MKQTVWLLLIVLVVGAGWADEADETKAGKPWLDIALVGSVNFIYMMALSPVRENLLDDYSWSRVAENFRHPWKRAVEGGREDHNSFWINYVGHPLSFCSLGLYLKARGYSNTGALVFTQTQNIFWEYVIEGGLWKPSGKDLVSDLLGSLAGIYLLHPLSDLGERKLKQGDRRWGNHLLVWLNPFKKINRWLFGRRQKQLGLVVSPLAGGFTVSLLLKPGD